ncbi:toxin-antitoxin system, toxin component, PIN family protein [Yinghuangia sp. ASG 101]|uniref:PIN-like domain-containing protein n=1 Tax=Yinghuangia sp. ASG 101 TaxID=2896848 RepID=UPI001E2CABE2|nr:toxin-antitoxin system, toxin component, PIN family protein [Yinghuangia sp. ASG 101]UGQ09509.1 toxin-antitoxin system, toxin component, PIN family protein [Yinghuangia sp. ASG 101]
MSRSKRSAEQPPPEFCFDRNLGKSVPARLSELGWKVHRICDLFPDDAQQTDDATWITAALVRGWVPVCKDGRIRGRDHERRPLEEHAGVLFYLDNQGLPIAEMVRRLHAAQDAIHRAVARCGPATYAVRVDRIERTWP